MTYEQALQYIHSTKKFQKSPELSRIRVLLDKMGNPQKTLKYVHITGTNGKGSTSAMIESCLSNYKTGLFVSPYIEDFRERIQVNRNMISEEKLCEICENVKNLIEEIVADGGVNPTEFEIVTAIAFQYFADCKCDIVVLEVGMGGLRDSTNIIDNCEVAVITKISLDHQEWLGETLQEITREKCGIIKPYCSVVSAVDQVCEDIIKKTCETEDVRLTIPDKNKLTIGKSDINGTYFVYKQQKYFVPLCGEHQVYNALNVIETLNTLQQRGFEIKNIFEGIKSTVWKGRFEVLRTADSLQTTNNLQTTGNTPFVVFDGAHNPDAVDSLCCAIQKYFRGRKITIVMGMLKDKDFHYCVSKLSRLANVFVATQAGTPRALSATEIAKIAKTENIFPVASDAIKFSLENSQDVIIICGSLYLYAEAKTFFSSCF